MRTVILILSLAVFGFGCAKKPDPQAPCNFVQNSDLQRVSWKSNVPYQIYIDSSLPSQFHDSVRAAAATWNTKLGKTAVNIIDNTSTPPFGQDGVSVLYWLTDWPTDRTWEQARTTIYWEDTLIIEADIKVNGRDYSYSAGTTDTVSSTSVDFQS